MKKMKIIKKTAALLSLTAVLFCSPGEALAADVVKSGAVSSLSTAQSETLDSGSSGTITLSEDPNCSPDSSEALYGYTAADVRAIAEDLYGFIDNADRREMYIQSIVNSAYYDPENCMIEQDGTPLLVLYRGSTSQYGAYYNYLIEGLTFFNNPSVVFAGQGDQLIVAVETGSVFTAQQAADNLQKLQNISNAMHTVRDTVSTMETGDKAKYICDYVADTLNYDTSYQSNCLADAVNTGISACVGYNAETLLLFGNSGIPYRSILATEDSDEQKHILGTAEVGKSWLIFDTTNYDQDYGKEPYWIFSDTSRESRYYSKLSLLQPLPEND